MPDRPFASESQLKPLEITMPPTKSSHLTPSQRFRFNSYLLAQWDWVEQNTPNRPTLAARASRDLGFRISSGHITTALLAIDRQMPKLSTNGRPMRAAEIRVLAESMLRLYRLLGVDPHEDFVDMFGDLGGDGVISEETE